MLEHAGGIVFESVVSDETLRVARKVAQATGYEGQLSLDFLRTDRGELHVIECNPRPCAGLVVMPDAMFDAPRHAMTLARVASYDFSTFSIETGASAPRACASVATVK